MARTLRLNPEKFIYQFHRGAHPAGRSPEESELLEQILRHAGRLDQFESETTLLRRELQKRLFGRASEKPGPAHTT